MRFFHRCSLLALLLVAGRGASSAFAVQELPEDWPEQLELKRSFNPPDFRQAGSITGVLPLPDGKRLLTCARDGSVRLWDIATRKELRRFAHHEDQDIWSVHLLPDGKRLLSAGGNDQAILWNLESGEELHRFTHEDTVFRAVPMPDGKRMVTVDYSNHAILWDLENGQELGRFAGHTDGVYAAAWSADGKRLYTGSEDDTVRRWSSETRENLEVTKRGTGDIFTLRLSPDGQHLLVCTEDAGVQVWKEEDLSNRYQVRIEGGVNCGAWAPNAREFVAIGGKKQLVGLNLNHKTPSWIAALPKEGTQWGVAYSSDGRHVYCGMGNLLSSWDAATGKQIFPAPDEPFLLGAVQAMAVSPITQRLYLVLDETQGVFVYDRRTDHAPVRWRVEDEWEHLELSPDGRYLLLAGRSGAAEILDAQTGKTISKLQITPSQQNEILDMMGPGFNEGFGGGGFDGFDVFDESYLRAFAFVPDRESILVAGDGGLLARCALKDGQLLRRFKGRSEDIHSLSVDAGGNRFVVSYDDGVMEVWALHEGNKISTLRTPDESPGGALFSPADHRSVVAVRGNSVHLWAAPKMEKPALALDAAAVEKLVVALGAEGFRERRAATRALMAAGEQILPLLAEIENDDPEVKARLAEVQRRTLESIKYPEKCFSLELEDELSGLTFDPSGRFWACTEGRDAQAAIVIGSVEEGNLKVLKRLRDGGSPRLLQIDADGTLYTGNRDGAVRMYRTE